MEKNKTPIQMNKLDSDALCALADSIWDEPEICFEEVKTTRKQQDFLIKSGFSIDKTDCGIATAYVARWGHGKPVIAFLAEMDALCDMSQQADAKAPLPLSDKNYGHGCGHNLLGAGAIGAAILYKEALETANKEGTVLVIGCPAEENGSGKSILVRNKIFDGVDYALTWHPSIFNFVCSGSNQSYIQASYRFTGKAAHAAVSPYQGRSSLNALELMNTGIAFMREHIFPSQQVHYAITNAGGTQSNIIQAEAEETCLIRAASSSDCESLYNWINDIAKGAGLMTQTELSVRFMESAASMKPVQAMEEVLKEAFLQVPCPTYTQEELEYLAYYKSLSDSSTIMSMIPSMFTDAEKLRDHISKNPICDYYIPSRHSSEVFPGSSDVGDVSQVCPTGVINTACFAYGTFPHTWMWTTQGKSSPAHKGMLYAAQVLATAAWIINNPDRTAAIQTEWQTKNE